MRIMRRHFAARTDLWRPSNSLCDHDIKPNEYATTQIAATFVLVARVKYPLFNFVLRH